jgi:hypothetical protein
MTPFQPVCERRNRPCRRCGTPIRSERQRDRITSFPPQRFSWLFLIDLGFLGGPGTDPNGMIPFVVLAAGGYLALTRPVPQPADGAAAAVVCPPARPSPIANQVVQAASTEASAARIPNAPA